MKASILAVFLFSALVAAMVVVSFQKPATYLVKEKDNFRVTEFVATNKVTVERLDGSRFFGGYLESRQVLTNGQIVSVEAVLERHLFEDRFVCFMVQPKQEK